MTRDSLRPWRVHAVAIVMALAFTSLFYILNSQKYLSFQTISPDAERFSQAIWNTLHGRFLYSTVKEGSILQNHFSPYMALLSPLLLLWQDVRALYLVQIAGIAVAGLILYKLVYDRRPLLALAFLAAFFLNPALHTVALFELRRVTLAAPYVALAMVGLYAGNRRLILLSALFLLLIKEDLGLIVLGMGLFLLLTGRDRKLGAVLTVTGAGWFVLAIMVVIPAFGSGEYLQSSYFESWGSSFPAMILGMVSRPIETLGAMFDGASLAALGRVLLPAAVVLPFLGAEYLLIAVPHLAAMLLSTTPEMHTLQRWYMAPILPILYAAVAVGLNRLPGRRATWGAALLLATTLLAYRQYSPAPLGKLYAEYLYDVTDRDRAAWKVLDMIPAEASVSAQAAFATQLAQREQIAMFEAPDDVMTADYTVLAEGLNAHPIPAHELHWEILNVLAQPAVVIEADVDGVYLVRPDGPPNPAIPVERVIGETMLLEQVDLAVTDADGLYQPLAGADVVAPRGSGLRVSLFWRALEKVAGERTISVRLTDPAGNILAQVDSQPADGLRPTSWWLPGWWLREVRYLAIPGDAPVGPASLDLVVYDSYSGERLADAAGETVITLARLSLAD